MGILSIIFELETITRIYASMKGGAKAVPKTPDGEELAPQIYGFVEGSLLAVDLAMDKYALHAVMLLRNQAMTIKYGIVKLLQDYFRVKACASCAHLLPYGELYLTYINGLLHFLYTGLGPVFGGKPAKEAFEDWYILNKKEFAEKASLYYKFK